MVVGTVDAVAESKGLTVSPTDEHEANDRDEPAETETAGTETAETAETVETVEAEKTEKTEKSGMTEAEEETPKSTAPVSYHLRRAPRYRAFGLTGLVIGVILGAVLAISSPASGDYSSQTILGYFVAIFALLGALLGSGAAVLLDRRKG